MLGKRNGCELIFVLFPDFSFPQLRLNTKFEHSDVNTGGCHWRLK